MSGFTPSPLLLSRLTDITGGEVGGAHALPIRIMELQDLRHLVDTYLGQAGLPPRDPDPLGFFVLPLTNECSLGVEWQAQRGEALLFANPGYALPHVERCVGRRGTDSSTKPWRRGPRRRRPGLGRRNT